MKLKAESSGQDMDEKEREIILTKIGAYYVELKKKLTLASSVYNDYKNKSKARLAKQVRNIDTTNQYDDQELDRIIEEDPEVLQKMVKQQVLGKASLKMQYAAQDILEKCQGIKVLQRNVRELMDMLKEISQIVALQGEQINSIAAHCDAAKNHMDSANKNLVQAKKHHSSMRCVG
jgi:t-SNARE complex subunit (syntaxin)